MTCRTGRAGPGGGRAPWTTWDWSWSSRRDRWRLVGTGVGADLTAETGTGGKRSAGGAPVWENKKATGGQSRYLTYERTGHNKQAVFKGADFRNPFQSTKDSARDGTHGLDVSPDGKVLGLKWRAK